MKYILIGLLNVASIYAAEHTELPLVFARYCAQGALVPAVSGALVGAVALPFASEKTALSIACAGTLVSSGYTLFSGIGLIRLSFLLGQPIEPEPNAGINGNLLQHAIEDEDGISGTGIIVGSGLTIVATTTFLAHLANS